MEEQLRKMLAKASKDSYGVYLREIALLMEENDRLKEKIKELNNEAN